MFSDYDISTHVKLRACINNTTVIIQHTDVSEFVTLRYLLIHRAVWRGQLYSSYNKYKSILLDNIIR